MRIAVVQTGRSHQHVICLQGLYHGLIGIPDAHTGEQLDPAVELAVVADRIIDRQVVAHADRIVFQTVCRRGVHQTGTGVGGDMVAADDRHLPRVERMLQRQMFECCALATGQYLRAFLAITL